MHKASIIALSLTVAIGAAQAQKAQPAIVELPWFERAALLADRTVLTSHLQKAPNITLRPETHGLLTLITRGVGQPGYRYLSYGDTGFSYSWQRYWPASTVKLMAAIGALLTLGKHGLSGDTHVAFSDADGSFSGPVHRLYTLALHKSTNVEYNRLFEIAGFREMNESYMTASAGMPHMIMQRRYTHPKPDANLRDSPEITFRHGKKTGTIPARHDKTIYPQCPEEANCVTLFELQEVLRRFTLHREIPKGQRFAIGKRDRRRLMKLLLGAPNKYEPGISNALGPGIKIYNKAGRVPGDDHLDNALIIDRKRKRRYMFALSVPYTSIKEPDQVTKKQLEVLAEWTFKHIRGLRWRSRKTPWLQADTGPTLKLQFKPASAGQYPLAIVAGEKVTRIDAYWRGRRSKLKTTEGSAELTLNVAGGRPTEPLVLVSYQGKRRVGYRLVGVRQPGR